MKEGFGDKARERYYYQKCLCIIDVERWKDKTDVYMISKPIENLTKHNSSSKKDCYNDKCDTIRHNKCINPKGICDLRISSPS